MSTIAVDNKAIQNKKGGLGTALLCLFTLTNLSLWGFAFFPAKEMSLEWMSRTQYVCFGTLPNGLPDVQGWMLLVLGPLMLLSVMWAMHPGELYQAPRYIKKSIPSQLLVGVLTIAVIWVGTWVAKRISVARDVQAILNNEERSQNPLPADYPRMGQVVPSFSLINHRQENITEAVFQNKVTLLTFAFAHCSTVCPGLIKDSLDAMKQLEGKEVQLVVISIDPWRDTPSILATLAKTWSFPENSHLLSESPEVVLKVLEGFKVTTARDTKTGDINHAAQTMIVGPKGQIEYSFLNPSVEWLTSAAKRVSENP